MATLESIQTKIAKLQAQAEAIVATKSTVGLNKIRELMDKHGISVSDIDHHLGKRGAAKGGKTGGTEKLAKYVDPKSGETWSGRGRAPQWIAKAKDRSKFLAEGGAASAAETPKRDGNYVRGVQPALYRNPKTGATWSGRGRAPAWMANVRDRTRFLIADAATAASEPTPTKTRATSKAAPVKKVTAAKKPVRAKAATSSKAEVAATKAIGTKKGASTKAATVAKKGASNKAASVAKKVPAKKKAVTPRKATAGKKTAASVVLSSDVSAASVDSTAQPVEVSSVSAAE